MVELETDLVLIHHSETLILSYAPYADGFSSQLVSMGSHSTFLDIATPPLTRLHNSNAVCVWVCLQRINGIGGDAEAYPTLPRQ